MHARGGHCFDSVGKVPVLVHLKVYLHLAGIKTLRFCTPYGQDVTLYLNLSSLLVFVCSWHPNVSQ